MTMSRCRLAIGAGRLTGAFVTASVLAAAPGLAGAAAQAHTDLVSSSPAEGERLREAPREIALSFSEQMDPQFAAATLTRPGQGRVDLDLQAGAAPTELIAPLPAPSAVRARTEEWRIAFRVTSTDGHPITGSVEFLVAATRGPLDQPTTIQPPTDQTLDPPTADTDADTGAGAGTAPGADGGPDTGPDASGTPGPAQPQSGGDSQAPDSTQSASVHLTGRLTPLIVIPVGVLLVLIALIVLAVTKLERVEQ